MRKNIAILHYSFLPVVAGVEIQIKGRAEVLARNHHRVKVVVGEGKAQDKDYQVKVVSKMSPRAEEVIKVQRELRQGKVSPSFFSLKQKLVSSLAKEIAGVDVCLLDNLQTMPFNFALTAALREIIEKTPRTKFFIWSHDIAPARKDYPFARKDYPFNLLVRPVIDADYVAISEFRKKQLAKILGFPLSKIKVIPDGIDLKSLLEIGEKVWKFQEKINLLDSDLIMFYPSRMLQRKNFELSFKIIKNLKKNFKEVKLLITAPPDITDPSHDYYNFLKGLTKKLKLTGNVYFLRDFKKYFKQGKVSFSQIKDFYKLVDLLLFTSREEGCGLPLLEAAASRLPMAVSDIPPFREIGGKEMLYFPLNQSPKKIAQRITSYLSCHAAFLLKRKIRKKYTWQRIYQDYLKPALKV